MKIALRIGSCILFAALTLPAFSQNGADTEQQNIIEQRIEQLAENEDESSETDYTTLFDNLSYYYENNLNLNQAKKEDLRAIMLLSDFQIQNLLTHIEKNGRLISIYELQAVEGFDLDAIRGIVPFVKVSADLDAVRVSFKELIENGKSELFVRYHRILEEQEGYSDIEDSLLLENPNRRYLGSQDKLFTRYRFKYRNNISFGITAEKDAGEQFFIGTQPNGYDFYSAHFFLQGFGKVKSFALGDYQLQLGQGLTFWSGLALRKSFDVMTIKKNAPGIRPYASVNENLFMRGAATTIALGKIELTGFASSKNIDANVTGDSTLSEDEAIVSSFLQSGFHRTNNELQDKNTINETHFGGNVAYKSRNLQFGATAIRSEYGAVLNPSPSPYNQFNFNGNSNMLLGMDYNYIFRNFNFFGEIARSENGGIGYINGALIALDPKLSFSIFHRNFRRDFQAPLSNVIRESSRAQNEEGLFMGVQFRINSNFTFYTYFDRFRFPWLQFSVSAPTNGYDYLGQINYHPSRNTNMYLRYRYREKPRNTQDDIDDVDFLVYQGKETIRYDVSYKVSDAIRLKNRVELAAYHLAQEQPDRGFMVFQDITYKALSSPWTFTARYALFDTDSYNSRIYAYENDVLYAYSIPGFYLKGSRMYLMVRWAATRSIDIWVRYSQYLYNNRDTIGSGLEEIQGRTKSDIKAQIRVRF